MSYTINWIQRRESDIYLVEASTSISLLNDIID